MRKLALGLLLGALFLAGCGSTPETAAAEAGAAQPARPTPAAAATRRGRRYRRSSGRPLLGELRPALQRLPRRGVGWPVLDERGLYERLCLEGFQSGLSWLTILRKREGFRAAFAGFDPERVARFGAARRRTTARRRGDREASRQDRGCDRERPRDGCAEGDGDAAAGARLVAPRGEGRPRAALGGGLAVDHARVDRAREGAAASRLSLRRPHHGLRRDAGLRGRERSPGHLSRARSGRTRPRSGAAADLSSRPEPSQPAQNRHDCVTDVCALRG